jgi:MFS family permease
MEDLVQNKPSFGSTELKTRRIKATLGLYIAIFICGVAGMQNDVIMAKYLPLEFSSDSAVFGLTFTMFRLGKFMMMIPLAKLSDKLGRKSLLLFTFGIYSFGTFLAGLAQTIEQFLFYRFLKGMSSFEAIALALINDYFEEGKRGKPIALLFTSLGIGSLLGTLTGGFFLNWFQYRQAFYFLGLITFIPIPVVLILIKNPSHTKELYKHSGSLKLPRISLKSQKSFLRERNYILGIIIGMIITFLYSGISSYTIYIVINYFKVNNELSGILLIPTNGAYIFLSLTVGNKENPLKLIKRGLAILALIFAVFVILRWIDRISIFIALLVLCFGLLGILMPAIDNFQSNIIPANVRGEAFGIYRSLTLVGSIIGSAMIGIIGSIFWVFTPFLLMGLFSMIGLFVSLFIKTKNFFIQTADK